MAISIKNSEADRLARELARRTGEGLTEAVLNAIRERLARVRSRVPAGSLAGQIHEIGQRCARLPVVDHRTAEEILSYDERGLPL